MVGMSRIIARGLMAIVPEKSAATVNLNVRHGTPESVVCPNCWIKPLGGGLAPYGNINVEQDKTIIKVPDHELNPTGSGRQIRSGDTISFEGNLYRVTAVGGNLRSVRTVWDCAVQQEFN